MSSAALPPPLPPRGPARDEAIRRRIAACPKLASLQSVNTSLSALVRTEGSLNSQIAEVIRRDPSLSTRLLRMVNSVYYGLSARVNSLEEAVFFLGLRQIRQLSLATPIIEELDQLRPGDSGALPWKSLWAHSIGTALLTREILAATTLQVDDETDYLAGLLHHIGKVVMAHAFPEELRRIVATPVATAEAACALERELIGWDHAEIGAHYLERHQLPEEIVQAVRHHHQPGQAPRHITFAAAVQVADHLARWAGIADGFERLPPAEADGHTRLPGWTLLFGADGPEAALARASLGNVVQRLPAMLEGLL